MPSDSSLSIFTFNPARKVFGAAQSVMPQDRTHGILLPKVRALLDQASKALLKDSGIYCLREEGRENLSTGYLRSVPRVLVGIELRYSLGISLKGSLDPSPK